jgi:hypothetical protein
MSKYRPISVEVAAPITSGAAITVSDANVVRATNTAGTTPYLVSLVNDADEVVSSMTLVPLEVALIDKPKGWKVFAANASVKLVSVTYPS